MGEGMSDLAPDRRRNVRRVIVDTELSVLAFPIPVRLIDISLSGVMLEATQAVALGTQGTIRFNFAGDPFSADVKVERLNELAASSHGPRFSIGATFVTLRRLDQQVIERFANQ